MFVSVALPLFIFIIVFACAVLPAHLKVRELNKKHAIYKELMDQKQANMDACFAYIANMPLVFCVKPRLMFDDKKLQEFMNKDEEIIIQIGCLGKIFDVSNLRIRDNVESLVKNLEAYSFDWPHLTQQKPF